MSLCGCRRLSVDISRYFIISRCLNPVLVRPSLNAVNTRSYRRGERTRFVNLSDAESYISLLSSRERRFLNEALKVQQEHQKQDSSEEIVFTIPTVKQLRLAALHSAIPFIGFGFLDNAIMIVAGEYIDMTLGAAFGISTMAAAALGNIVSDVSGIGLAHYVELAANKLGFEGPGLSSKQTELPRTRFVVNLGRAIGIVIGCVLGMFPLLFYSTQEKEKELQSS